MITKDEAIRLFTGYPNYSIPVMREFIDLVFGLIPPGEGYLPLEGGTMLGNIGFPIGTSIVFPSSDNTPSYGFIGRDINTVFFNTTRAGSNLQCFGHTLATFRGGEATVIGTAGKLISFFGGGTPVARQTVANDVFSTPTPDFPSVIAEIEKLQDVVNDLRTGVVNLNLFELTA